MSLPNCDCGACCERCGHDANCFRNDAALQRGNAAIFEEFGDEEVAARLTGWARRDLQSSQGAGRAE